MTKHISGRTAGAERRAGRRAISVSLLMIGVFAMVSGIWSLLLPRGSFALPSHVAAGSLFGLLSLLLPRGSFALPSQHDFGWHVGLLLKS